MNSTNKTEKTKTVTPSTKTHIKKLTQGSKITVGGKALKCLPTDQSSR